MTDWTDDGVTSWGSQWVLRSLSADLRQEGIFPKVNVQHLKLSFSSAFLSSKFGIEILLAPFPYPLCLCQLNTLRPGCTWGLLEHSVPRADPCPCVCVCARAHARACSLSQLTASASAPFPVPVLSGPSFLPVLLARDLTIT